MNDVFWISWAILFYCYIGYGTLLYLVNLIRPASPKRISDSEPPAVTMIVAVYNEQNILEEKILNSLAVDYPPGKLHFIFVTDGSTDASAAIVRKYPSIVLLDGSRRMGKPAAIKKAMQTVKTPVVVFSDANTMLNPSCLIEIVRHYSNRTIGGVAGEKKIHPIKTSAVGQAEGLYWKYESFMKKLDEQFHTVVGAAGELFSIRTALFKPPHDDTILDDFVISMQICLQGYKIAYEPSAFATELPSASLKEEQKKKVRIAAGAYQSIHFLQACMNIFRHPLLSMQYFSRRLMRWVGCPPMLMILFFANCWIVYQNQQMDFYAIFLVAQLAFYGMALVGWLIVVNSGRKAGLLTIPFYFVFMNYCLVLGFFRFLMKKQSVLWEKSKRQEVAL